MNFFFILVGIKPWPSACKVHTLAQHQYYPMITTLYFTAL